MKGKSLVKLLISLVMLGLVLSLADLSRLKEIILGISPAVAIFIVLLYAIGQCINTIKWWLIARAGGIEASYFLALRSSFIGMFVNCFGFGLVGGDVARGILLANGRPNKAAAIASVVADRAHGLAILAAIGSISILCFGSRNMDSSLIALIFGLGVAIVLGWCFGPGLMLRCIPHSRTKLRTKVEEMVRVFPRDPRQIFLVSAISLLFHLYQIAMHWLMGLGLGLNLSWGALLVSVPFVNIVSSLPISWNGLGVRENAYIFFLTPAVLSKEHAIAFGAMWLLSVTVSSAIGGILSILTPDMNLQAPSEADADGNEKHPGLQRAGHTEVF